MKKFWLIAMGMLPTGCGELKETDESVKLTPVNVQAIFDGHCGCHLVSDAPFGQVLSENVSYQNIVNVFSGEEPTLKRIAPGDTTDSYLFRKIKGVNIQFDRMPADGPPYLSAAQVDVIRQWILDGAPAR